MSTIFITVLLALQLNAPAPSQETEAPPLPLPDRLAADWWAYFNAAAAEGLPPLEERIANFKSQLAEALDLLAEPRRAQVVPIRNQLESQLDRYYTLTQTPQPVPKPAPLPAETYTVQEALDRYLAWRQLEIEVKAQREELDWQRSLLDRTFTQQTQRRGAYLGLAKNAPERFETGLRLMASRTDLEARKLELAQQSEQLKLKEEELSNLSDEIDLIPKRLTADAADVAEWAGRQEEADAALETMRQSEAVPLATNSAGSDASPSAVARQSLLASVHRELELAVAEMQASRAALGYILADALAEGVEVELAASQPVEEYQQRAELADQLLVRSKSTAERVRAAANSQLSAAELDPASTQIVRDTVSLADSTSQLLRQLELVRGSAGYLADLLDQRQGGGWLTKSSDRTKRSISRVWNRVVTIFVSPLFEVNETPVTALGILRAIFILLLAWWGSKFLRGWLERIGRKRHSLNRSSLYALERLVHYTLLTLGVIVGLSSLGLDFTKFALFASALGVGVGFGLQTLVSNFISGIIILFERSLKVGDFVELQSGVTGEVREINMRSTLITTNDNVDILVPNSEFVGGHVTNWTLREALRRVHIPFGVAYGTDKEKVKTAVLEAAERVPWTYKDSKRREPKVWFVGFGDSSLDFELVVWLTPEAVKRPSAVQADYLWEIHTSLYEHKIEIPFPQRDLHLRSGFEKLRGADSEP